MYNKQQKMELYHDVNGNMFVCLHGTYYWIDINHSNNLILESVDNMSNLDDLDDERDDITYHKLNNILELDEQTIEKAEKGDAEHLTCGQYFSDVNKNDYDFDDDFCEPKFVFSKYRNTCTVHKLHKKFDDPSHYDTVVFDDKNALFASECIIPSAYKISIKMNGTFQLEIIGTCTKEFKLDDGHCVDGHDSVDEQDMCHKPKFVRV